MRDSPRPFARGATQLRRHDGAPLLRDRGEPLSSRNRTGTGAPANDRARRHLGGGAPRLDAGPAADVRVRPLHGTLEQMLLGATPLGMTVAAKVFAHWLVSGLPLVLISPVLALQFDFPQELLGVLTLSLALGTPVLSLIGAI